MKLSEQQLLELKCRLEKYITQRESMIAENKHREILGQNVIYVENDFEGVKNAIEQLENHICWLGEK